MNNRIQIYHLLVIGLILVLTNNCKKDDNSLPSETITDIEGNVYNTVTIGTQVWMVDNLKTSMYRNGDVIETTTPALLDVSGQSTPKYQWAYDGNESNVPVYGRLYTWYTITDTRNICPAGWHVPSEGEWRTLTEFLGGGLSAGGKLKETGTTHWQSPNTGATNESGFTALPGGSRGDAFGDLGLFGLWWSSTESSVTNAYILGIINYSQEAGLFSEDKAAIGVSVRCLKD